MRAHHVRACTVARVSNASSPINVYARRAITARIVSLASTIAPRNHVRTVPRALRPRPIHFNANACRAPRARSARSSLTCAPARRVRIVAHANNKVSTRTRATAIRAIPVVNAK